MVKSLVWGGADIEPSQGFGVNLPNVPDDWYAYAADWGHNYGDHVGLDVPMPRGTPIFAISGGVVTEEGGSPWFRPNPVHIVTDDDPTIPGDDREEHIYGHLWAEYVDMGQRVKPGDQLGISGEQTTPGTMTPDGSGAHLHFERRALGRQRAIDPTPLLTGQVSAGTDGTATTVNRLPTVGDGGGISGAIGRAVDGAAGVAKRVGIGVAGLVLLGLGLVVVFRDQLPIGRIGKAVAG